MSTPGGLPPASEALHRPGKPFSAGLARTPPNSPSPCQPPSEAPVTDTIDISPPSVAQDTAAPHAPAGRRRRRPPLSLLSVIGGFLLWEAALAVFEVSEFALVPPTQIIGEFVVVIRDGLIWEHLRISVLAFLFGFAVSAALAIPLGLIAGSSRTFGELASPWIAGLYATPMIALAPLLIIALGFGIQAKMAVVAFACFFPMVINTISGVKAVEGSLLDVSTAFGATRSETFRKVLLPGSVPFIMAGLQLAVGRGVVGLVVADLFGSRAGLGLFLLNSAQAFNIARVFVAALTLAMLGVLFSAVLRTIEGRMLRWRP